MADVGAGRPPGRRAGYSPYDVWGLDFGDETAALFTRLRAELQEVDA